MITALYFYAFYLHALIVLLLMSLACRDAFRERLFAWFVFCSLLFSGGLLWLLNQVGLPELYLPEWMLILIVSWFVFSVSGLPFCLLLAMLIYLPAKLLGGQPRKILFFPDTLLLFLSGWNFHYISTLEVLI